MIKIILMILLPVVCFGMPIDRSNPDLKPMVGVDWTKARAWEASHNTTCYHIEGQTFECTDGKVIK